MPFTRPRASQIVTTKQEIEDPIIEINAGATGVNTNDLGIIINRGSSGDNVGIIWDRSIQKFVLVQTGADGDSSGDLVFNQYADLEVDNLTADTINAITSLNVEDVIVNNTLTADNITADVLLTALNASVTGTLTADTITVTTLNVTLDGGTY